MLNYIKKLIDNQLYISEDYHIRIIDTTFQKLINDYLHKSLSTVKTTEKIIKKKLNYKSKIPIYIDKNNILMCIKSYRLDKTFYINYRSIFDYEFKNGLVYITFINYHTLKLKEKFTFINQLEKCRKIIKYLNG